MKRRILVLIILAFAMATGAWAQEVRVVDGRKFMVHNVLAGETLFAISRHYAVPVSDIMKENPATAAGLSIGQVLLIPQDAVNKKEKKNAPALFAGELAHTVARKETLYGIARKYSVDQADLIQRNPELAQGVREGMIVIIPVSKVTGATSVEKLPAVDDGSVGHLVMPGETLFSLGQRYGLDPELIESANGGLPEGLKAGTYIRIPSPSVMLAARPISADSLSRKERYNVAFLLPFSIDRNDSVMADPEAKGYDAYTSIALQFWTGAQMALDSLRDLGLNADVSVLDVGTDAATWSPVLRKSEMRDVDLFLGPFHRSAIDELARTSRGAHIVCPVPQSNKVLLGHPSVSKVMSSRPEQVQQLARYAARRFGRENIILCEPTVPAEKDLQEQMRRSLREALASQPVRMRDSLMTARVNKGDIAEVQKQLDPQHQNVIILPSEDVETVAAIVRSLVPLASKYHIVLFGLASWAEMNTLEPQDLALLDLHLPASTFIDYDDQRVRRFVRHYRDRFHAEPDEYAFLGFDVTFFYLSALMNEGRDFAGRFALVRTQPLHMGFRMQQAGLENGYRNESTFILHYQDLVLRKAD